MSSNCKDIHFTLFLINDLNNELSNCCQSDLLLFTQLTVLAVNKLLGVYKSVACVSKEKMMYVCNRHVL